LLLSSLLPTEIRFEKTKSPHRIPCIDLYIFYHRNFTDLHTTTSVSFLSSASIGSMQRARQPHVSIRNSSRAACCMMSLPCSPGSCFLNFSLRFLSAKSSEESSRISGVRNPDIQYTNARNLHYLWAKAKSPSSNLWLRWYDVYAHQRELRDRANPSLIT
jgi:hypothetical protein